MLIRIFRMYQWIKTMIIVYLFEMYFIFLSNFFLIKAANYFNRWSEWILLSPLYHKYFLYCPLFLALYSVFHIWIAKQIEWRFPLANVLAAFPRCQTDWGVVLGWMGAPSVLSPFLQSIRQCQSYPRATHPTAYTLWSHFHHPPSWIASGQGFDSVRESQR